MSCHIYWFLILHLNIAAKSSGQRLTADLDMSESAADGIYLDPALTRPDRIILQNLQADIDAYGGERVVKEPDVRQRAVKAASDASRQDATAAAVEELEALNDPANARFEPTVFHGYDLPDIRLSPLVDKWLFQPYVSLAKSIVRKETDVVMLNHLILYFTTSVPSAVTLFYRFSYIHGVLHFAMQMSFVGSYTLMMHQHIHMRGILKPKFWIFDGLFPYITDPLMGHTWNSYFYHHVKHHHVEGNGPDDLSSTIRYERDNVWHFLHYLGRFFFLIWLDLPLYFIRKRRTVVGLKAGAWELGWYFTLVCLFRWNAKATTFVFLLPLLMLRIGLMVGNWGQHALVDAQEPDSDYRSSITLIDVPSNRYCFNDGYHTSHHLNPLRHWRDHPAAFLKAKDLYASQHALVFHNIDYVFITVRLLMRDYETLAKCMVPIGEQIGMTMEERVKHLKSCTRPFSEEDIKSKFKL